MRFRPTLAVLSVAVIAMATAGAFVLFDGDNDVEADGSCGDGVTWSVSESGTTLHITRSTTTGTTGKMTDYPMKGAPWESIKGQFRAIDIGAGVTSIGEYAFFGCSYVSSVTIPDSVKSIGDSAFSEVAIESVTIPNSVQSIGAGAFTLTLLKSVTIPQNVTEISDHTFFQCSSLESITFNGNVGSIGQMAFFGCSKLETITIPDSVESIGQMAFSGCSKLGAISIPDSVVSIGADAFQSCTGLTEIHFGNNVSFTSTSDIFPSYEFYCDAAKQIVVDKNQCSLFQGATFKGNLGGMVWVPDDVNHEVTYNTDGGSEQPSATQVKEGNEFNVVTYEGRKDGYAFDGWSYGDEVYAAGDEIRMM